MTATDARMLTTPEVAERLDTTVTTVRKLRQRGVLRSYGPLRTPPRGQRAGRALGAKWAIVTPERDLDDLTRGAQPGELMKTSEVAERLGVTMSVVTKLARTGQLPGFQLCERGSWRFQVADVEEFERSGGGRG